MVEKKKLKKYSIIATVALVLVVALTALWFIGGKNPQDGNKNPAVSDLAFEALDGSEPAGVGFVLVFESDECIIFGNTFRVWGYDVSNRHSIFDVDLVKIFGEESQIQGSYDPYAVWVQSAADGKTVVLSCADRDASSNPETDREAYFIDTSTLTYHKGEYKALEDTFDRENTVGYIMPGGSLAGSRYIRGDETWNLFAEYGTQ